MVQEVGKMFKNTLGLSDEGLNYMKTAVNGSLVALAGGAGLMAFNKLGGKGGLVGKVFNRSKNDRKNDDNQSPKDVNRPTKYTTGSNTEKTTTANTKAENIKTPLNNNVDIIPKKMEKSINLQRWGIGK